MCVYFNAKGRLGVRRRAMLSDASYNILEARDASFSRYAMSHLRSSSGDHDLSTDLLQRHVQCGCRATMVLGVLFS